MIETQKWSRFCCKLDIDRDTDRAVSVAVSVSPFCLGFIYKEVILWRS